MKLLGRLLILPFQFLIDAMGASFRAGRAVGAVPVKLGRHTTRLLGFRGTVGLLLGVLLGLAFAPGPGRDLRAAVKRFVARQRGADDADLAARVTFELEHAPRTWHLSQPTVTVVSGRVILSGAVAQATERDELGRVAAAVPGAAAVDNLLEVDDELEPAPDQP